MTHHDHAGHDHDHDHAGHDHAGHDHDHAGHDHAGHDHDHDHAGHDHAHTPVDAAAEDVAECPVMPGSMTVKAEAEAAGLVREYEGKTYYLCCNACATSFDADPGKYAVA